MQFYSYFTFFNFFEVFENIWKASNIYAFHFLQEKIK